MADKLMSGIGRELRYMEYKLRKKHSEWDKDRKKTKQTQSDKKVPSMKEFTSDQVSPDLADALPTDTKEEDLQIQVALAISKEEMDEAERREESDRMRLELALKQSEAAMAETEIKLKQQQQPSTSSSKVDPWGTGEPQHFDPFSAAGPSTSAATPWQNLTLAKPQSVVPAASAAADPWAQGATTSQANKDRNDSFSELFGAGPAAPPPQVADPWGGQTVVVHNEAAAPKFDPFQSPAAPVTTPAAAFAGFTSPSAPQQAFDPLSEFDNLHLGNFNGAAAPTPAAMDPFVLEPLQPASSSSSTVTQHTPHVAEVAVSGKSCFLEENMSSLIDMNSLLPSKAATNPYTMTKPTMTNTTSSGNAHRNPFMLKSPAPSLNQMQSGGNQGSSLFGDNTAAVQQQQHHDFGGGGLMMQPQTTQLPPQQQQNFFAQPPTNNPFPTSQNPF